MFKKLRKKRLLIITYNIFVISSILYVYGHSQISHIIVKWRITYHQPNNGCPCVAVPLSVGQKTTTITDVSYPLLLYFKEGCPCATLKPFYYYTYT